MLCVCVRVTAAVFRTIRSNTINQLLKTDIELKVLFPFDVRDNTPSLRLVQQQTSAFRIITFICSNVILLGLC